MHLQDIEKLAPKRGVTLQSVKEVVQALVDDDLGELYSLPTMSSSICCMSGCIISSNASFGLLLAWHDVHPECQLGIPCSASRQDWSIQLLLVLPQRGSSKGGDACLIAQ